MNNLENVEGMNRFSTGDVQGMLYAHFAPPVTDADLKASEKTYQDAFDKQIAENNARLEAIINEQY